MPNRPHKIWSEWTNVVSPGGKRVRCKYCHGTQVKNATKCKVHTQKCWSAATTEQPIGSPIKEETEKIDHQQMDTLRSSSSVQIIAGTVSSASSSSSTIASTERKRTVQPKITKYFITLTPARIKTFQKLLAEAFITGDVSFSFASNPSFVKAFKLLGEEKALPHRMIQ